MRASACGVAIAGLTLVLAAAGCSPQWYKESADREVYSIIEQKTKRVPGMLEEFSIEAEEEAVLRTCPFVTEEEAFGVETPADAEQAEGREAEPAPPVRMLDLQRALEVAALNSREYQSQKEDVYLEALALTLERYRFDPQFFGTLTGNYDNTDSGDTEQVSGDSGFGFTKLFKTGALLSVNLATEVSQFLTGDPRKSERSILNLSITQPLLQGSGIAVTEPLTQAERDAIYQIRNFVRFRRQFFVRVLSDYYNVLESLQVLRNEQTNSENLQFTLERARARSEAGQLPPFQVEQTRQDVLLAADRVERARQRYEGSLDDFKITLGLPTEARVALDPDDLDRLRRAGVQTIEFKLEDASDLALKHRLDLLTANDRVYDAERKVEVAENDLLPGLDLSASLEADTEGNSPADFMGERIDTGVGFELDLPLDKRRERNNFRRRLIDLDRRQRDLCETRDRVLLSVRDSWRQYQRAQSTVEIQRMRVSVAQQRVENTQMLLEADRAITRDVLEAQEDLLSARNDLAATLVDLRVARLALARDMEILVVTETGQMEENFDEYL
ncbi:MAG: TolC family protein [Planctomycetota bacterium]